MMTLIEFLGGYYLGIFFLSPLLLFLSVLSAGYTKK